MGTRQQVPSAQRRATGLAFHRVAVRLVLACILVAAFGGCSGSFDGTRYRQGNLHFAVNRPPPSWRAIDASPSLLAFRDDSAEATIAVNGRCQRDGDDVPLSALTQHLFLMFTDRQIESQTIVPMDGREAQRTVLTAKLDGVRKKFAVVVLKKDGCVYDFMYIASPSGFAAGVSAFDQFVAGFHTERSSGGE